MHRTISRIVALVGGVVVALGAAAQNISIATGGTGGVYYPMGGGIAAVLSKYVPGMSATAEVTGGSVDNLELVGSGKPYIAFAMADASQDAYRGEDKFRGNKVPLRTLMVLYPNRTQIVTVEGTGITKLSDLKGKRVSTGAPGSGVEIVATRILEAVGLDPKKDLKQERLSVAESANAIKDRKIDAFFWVGGVPTAAVTDLAATPGIKIKLVDHAEAMDAMNKKYGALYAKGVIPAGAYSGQDKPSEIIDIWNILVVNDKMTDAMAYNIVKTLFEKKAELVAVHSEAKNIDLKSQAIASPLPFHPGAKKYLEEQGVKVN